MAQYQITLDSKLFHQLFLGDRDEAVAQLLESILNQVLQAQATEQLQAKNYERTEDRKDYRNGTYTRTLRFGPNNTFTDNSLIPSVDGGLGYSYGKKRRCSRFSV